MSHKNRDLINPRTELRLRQEVIEILKVLQIKSTLIRLRKNLIILKYLLK